MAIKAAPLYNAVTKVSFGNASDYCLPTAEARSKADGEIVTVTGT
jgi:hypothetical protein